MKKILSLALIVLSINFSSKSFDDIAEDAPRLTPEVIEDFGELEDKTMLAVENALSKIKFKLSQFTKDSETTRALLKNVVTQINKIKDQIISNDGFVQKVSNVVTSVEEFQRDASDTKEAFSNVLKSPLYAAWKGIKAPYLAFKGGKILWQADAINLEALLEPVHSLLISVSKIMQKVVSFRKAAGPLAHKSTVSKELTSALKKTIATMDIVSAKVKDIVDGGKKKFMSVFTSFDLAKLLFKNFRQLPAFALELKVLEEKAPLIIDVLSTEMTHVIDNVNVLNDKIMNFQNMLYTKLSKRKKEAFTGMIGPRILTQEAAQQIKELRVPVETVIVRMTGAISAISSLVNLIVTVLIAKTKELIGFELFTPKAFKSALELPAYLESLVSSVEEIQKQLEIE